MIFWIFPDDFWCYPCDMLLGPWCPAAYRLGYPCQHFPRNTRFDWMVVIDWFLRINYFYWLLMVSWENWMFSIHKSFNQNSFDEWFSCDYLVIVRLINVNVFQDSRTHWSTHSYVDWDVLCGYLLLSKTSWTVEVIKLKVNNLILLIKSLWKTLSKLKKK